VKWELRLRWSSKVLGTGQRPVMCIGDNDRQLEMKPVLDLSGHWSEDAACCPEIVKGVLDIENLNWCNIETFEKL
jgi:hypothetical protein